MMIRTEISLVLSSKAAFNPDTIAGAIPLRPFSIWRRKPGLVVHGVDDIPAMSWIYNRQADGAESSQSLVDSSLAEICSCSQKIHSAISNYGLEGTVICRLSSADESYCIEILPDLLSAVAACGCTMQFAADRE